MTVMEAIQERRSIRRFKSTPVEQEKLDKVLEAMRLAPSAKNIQNWAFIVVRDEEKRKAVAETALEFPSFIMQAPVILLCCGTKHDIMTNGHYVDTVNLSIAMSFGVLEACEQGLGTCIIASHQPEKIRKVMDLPDDVNVVLMTPLGYADQDPRPRPRKPLEDIVMYEEYRR